MNASEIVRSIPKRFKKKKVAPDYETRIHFTIKGDRGGKFTVEVKDGVCSVQEGLIGEPKCTVKTKDKVYEAIEMGKKNAQMAFMMGKIKISDIGELTQFIKLVKKLS